MRNRIILTTSAALALAFPWAPSGAQPVTQSISDADKATGSKAHPELVAEFGGAYAGAQSEYVRRVGQKVSVQSGLSNAASDFNVTTLNSSVNNAFAIPGGYLYVTRQLLALMNDEAELASVLGHETAHVSARHSQRRQKAATRNSVIGLLGQVLAGAVLGGNSVLGKLASQAAGTGAQLLTLGFSRKQEYEADDLGVTFMAKAGYDPMASSSMLAQLAAQSALDARAANQDARSTPSWASTHPDPASRVRRAADRATSLKVTNGLRNRDAFLNALDGVLYDDDPKQGVVDGQTFRHSELKLQFTVPAGYAMSNGAQAVTIQGSGGQAQFTGAAYDGDLDRYIAAAFNALSDGKGGINYATPQRRDVGGIQAAVAQGSATTQSGKVDVTVYAYAFDSKTAYHFVTIARAGSGAGAFGSMFDSMRRMTTAEAAAVKPRVIDVVTVKSGDTIESVSARMAYSALKVERFLTLNALPAGTALRPGQRVKIVIYN
jgi:predicted Zn-dependent protease